MIILCRSMTGHCDAQQQLNLRARDHRHDAGRGSKDLGRDGLKNKIRAPTVRRDTDMKIKIGLLPFDKYYISVISCDFASIISRRIWSRIMASVVRCRTSPATLR